MAGSFRRRYCKCPTDRKRCSCGAKWYYRYDIIDAKTGKRKQKEVGGFDTKTDAIAAAKTIQHELLEGTYIEEKNITFGEFANEWIDLYYASGKVKISTVRVRRHEIGRLSAYFEHLRIKDITRKQYQDALNDLKSKGYADNTMDGVHSTGRKIFGKAVEFDVIKVDPTEFATVPKVQKTIEEIESERSIPKYLEKGELAHFLNIAKTDGLDRDFEMFMMLAYTGMRVGELCALKWSDIDLEEHTVSITKTYYNPKNNIRDYTLLTPKTKRSRRVIDIDEDLVEVLKDFKAKQSAINMRYRKTYYDKGFVFAQTDQSNAGYPVYTKLLGNRMTRLLKIARLNTDLTPHSLRHTHTSLLAEAGVSLEVIMDRLGHSDDQTTKDIYLHITKPRKKEASHKFAQLMRHL